MGTRGPVEKRTGRQRRNASKVVSITPGGAGVPMPPAAKEWLVVTKNSWAAFWASELVQLVVPALDTPALRRLFDLRDERERASRAARKRRMVEGSQGQPVLNPLLKYVADCDKEIRALEDRFGLTTMGRMRVGAKFGEAAKSLEDLNRGFDDEDIDDEASSADEDPRRRAIDV